MPEQPPDQTPQLETIRVLLVEDDPDDAFLFQEMLAEVATAEFAVTHADRMSVAQRCLGAGQFDVILLDLSLPDSQGFDTFDAIKAAAPDLPIVVLTGFDDETMALRAVQGGAQDYLVKGGVESEFLSLRIRYAVERQRTIHYRALMTERMRFDTAVSQMTDGIIVTDADWRPTTANRAARLLLNLQDDSWKEAPLEHVLSPFTLSEDIADVWDSADRVTAFDIARPDTDPPLYIDARLTRITDESGQLVSSVLILRDVTSERREANVRADFLTNLSHKVRTPLTVLIGYLGLCKKLPPDRLLDEWPDLIETCDAEVRRLNEDLQALLAFKVTEARPLEADAGAADVPAVIESQCNELRERYESRQLEVAVQIAPNATRVDAGADHVGRVLNKILDNAVKFATKEPVRLAIEVAPHQESWVRFSVTDNGPGIPHEYLDRVFQEFVQVEDLATGEIPGLGVGLHMAKQVVEAHGGTIDIRSDIGLGTTVLFTFPASEESDSSSRPLPR